MRRGFWAIIFAGIIFYMTATPWIAADTLRIEKPWARASLVLSRPAAAYLTIVNDGQQAVSLIGGESPLAERVEIHRIIRQDDVMNMSPVQTLEIMPHAQDVFAPGGLHIMLLGLKQPLQKGQQLPLKLRFSDGRMIEVIVPVKGPGAKTADE